MDKMTNNKKYYPDNKSNPNFADISEQILAFWEENKIFEASVANRPKGKNGINNDFVFFDGPPFANGLPHYGHLLTGFVKDIVARYQTLKGKRVERRFGWDCHGLPVEMEVEKELKLSGRTSIIEYGIDKFNEHCRKSVMKYANEWQDYVTKQARWVDFKNSYKTMDLDYMESVMWAFKKLYDAGLIYESKRVMPYSWACQTPLSNFETRMDNAYRQVTDKTVTVKFALKSKPHNAPKNLKNYYLLAWTTTPWSLPADLALAVGKDINYSCVVINDDCYILAKNSLPKYKKELAIDDEDYDSHSTIKGSDLEGLEYIPPFDYFKNHPNSFKVFAADFVTEGDGTSIVHIAPGFGEDDQALCAEKNIELVCPVDDAGKFTDEVYDFAGLQVFEANDKIIIKLKEQGMWFKTEQYIHNYPHCWRTDTPLIYKAVPSWYVKVTEIKERLIANNQKINWIPDHIKDGLFGKWLENVRDWSISRNRFWGTPIPIWISDDTAYPRIDVYGSIAELEKDFGVKVTDLHRPYIDDLVRPNPDDPTGKSMMRRVSDVFDCWFDSGSMPYGQKHYPFEGHDKTPVPADFIVEYTAQTRGWFYTLTVLAAALFDSPAFLNCICHGVILDEKGEKLSKRLRNYVDPMEVFNAHGSDALRFFMASSSVLRGQELHIDKDGKMFVEVVRLVLKPIWNAYHFFTLYANSDHIQAKLINTSQNLSDRYILSKLKYTVEKIGATLDAYDIPAACNAVSDLFEVLNNWHIRRNRSRFWKKEKDLDKQEAYDTLYTVLYTISIAASPLLPLLCEHIYLGLTDHAPANSNGNLRSVHLCDYPDNSAIVYDQQLIEDIDKIRDICTAGLNIRNTYNIRIRQPLQKLTVIGNGLGNLNKYFDLIKDEVNVKEVVVSEEIERYAKYNLKINFKLIAERLSNKMKDIVSASKTGFWELLPDKSILICDEKLEGDEFILTLEALDDAPSAQIESLGALAQLDTNITKELRQEAIARDLVRAVQQMRKDAGFDISDRIGMDLIVVSQEMVDAIKLHEKYICEQTLATQINYLANSQDKQYSAFSEANIEDEKITIGLMVSV